MNDNPVRQNIEAADISTFAMHCKAMNVVSVLEIGAGTGQFAVALRGAGFEGTIISVEADITHRVELLKTSLTDPHWIVLPNCEVGDMQNGALVEEGLEPNVLAARILLKCPPSTLRLSQLIEGPLASRVGALRIADPGRERDILQTADDAFPSLRILSIVTNSAGGSPAVDLSDVLNSGFMQIRPYQSQEALVRTYVNPSAPMAVAAAPMEMSAIVTSMGGIYKRPDSAGIDHGADWLNSCLASWAKIAPINYSISEVNPPVPAIAWVKTSEKPAIAEIFQKVEETTDQHVIITNSDVLLSASLAAILPKLDPDVMYFGKRMEVKVDVENNNQLVELDYFYHGLDFFIVPNWVVKKFNREKLIPEFFRYGEPFWDWGVPIATMQNRIPAKQLQLTPAAVLHMDHLNVSMKWWDDQGTKFLFWCDELDRAGPSPATSILKACSRRRILAQNEPRVYVSAACLDFFDWIGLEYRP